MVPEVAAEVPPPAKPAAKPSAKAAFDAPLKSPAAPVIAAETAAYARGDAEISPGALGPEENGGEHDDGDDRNDQRISSRHS